MATERSGRICPGLRSNALKTNDRLFCDWIIVLKSGAHTVLHDLESRLHQSGLYTAIVDQEDKKLTFIKLFAPLAVLELTAEKLNYKLPLHARTLRRAMKIPSAWGVDSEHQIRITHDPTVCHFNTDPGAIRRGDGLASRQNPYSCFQCNSARESGGPIILAGVWSLY